jgi:hypothetical protein
MTVPARYRCSRPWPAKAAPASGETPLNSGSAAKAASGEGDAASSDNLGPRGIGSVFGIIVYALDRADLLPLKPRDSVADELYFYAAIAFFAGFSERWAQSTLKNAIPLSGPSAPPSDTLVLSSHSEGKLVR